MRQSDREAWDIIDEAVDGLERGWASGASPDLSALVPATGHPIRKRTLVTLIKVDQEYRWRSGQRKLVEEYLEDWPELSAASETVGLIDEAHGFKPEIRAAFIINRRIPNTVIGRDVEEALSEYEIPMLKQAIAQRVAFSEASSGYTVMEMSATSSASKEIKKLAKEVLNLMEVKSW